MNQVLSGLEGVVAALRELPVRIRVALGATLLAVLVLLVAGLAGGDGDESAATSTTSTSTTASGPTLAPSSIQLRPDWYRKGNSRYSQRGPTPTVSSLPSSSTSSTTATSSTVSASGTVTPDRSGPGSGSSPPGRVTSSVPTTRATTGG